ncbi:transposase [Streptomyces sp. 2112.3]|uniref:IS110 family transposase n=1 Tax=Streptomyces sp. 2112.3 TaxID=1881023 RepID=UPI002108FB07|nr:transposase [Streptomyces sp. 2112.3]
MIGTEEFPATVAGYRELHQWASSMGAVRRAGVEGTGSFGAALSRYLLAQGVEVIDVNRPDRTDRRRRGKTDPLDAQNAAWAVLSGRARARAKSGDGRVQIARMYKLAEGSAVKARTQATNQLKAVLVSADPNLREELAVLGNAELFRTCAGFAVDSKRDRPMPQALRHPRGVPPGQAHTVMTPVTGAVGQWSSLGRAGRGSGPRKCFEPVVQRRFSAGRITGATSGATAMMGLETVGALCSAPAHCRGTGVIGCLR